MVRGRGTGTGTGRGRGRGTGRGTGRGRVGPDRIDLRAEGYLEEGEYEEPG